MSSVERFTSDVTVEAASSIVERTASVFGKDEQSSSFFGVIDAAVGAGVGVGVGTGVGAGVWTVLAGACGGESACIDSIDPVFGSFGGECACSDSLGPGFVGSS